MTVAVLGLDAADYDLLQHWSCDNILQANHGALKTVTHSLDVPKTIEVWPAIASGEHPKTHGLTARSRDWPGLLEPASRIASHVLPMQIRSRLGMVLRSNTLQSEPYDPVEDDTLFNQGFVWNWPGVTRAGNWSKGAYWRDCLRDGTLTRGAYRRRLLALTGQEMGYLTAMATETHAPIVGVHSHVLDHAGHVWADDPESLRGLYETVDAMVSRLLEDVGELVILSDHGMQSDALDDDEPGKHSMRAVVSTSFDDGLPESVLDVRGWLEDRVNGTVIDEDQRTGVGVSDGLLRDLGYLS